VRPGLSFVWKRPVLCAAVLAALESGLLYVLQRFVWDREAWLHGEDAWFGAVVYFATFFVMNLFAAMRERRRRQPRDRGVASP
jgi:hypothetical protein